MRGTELWVLQWTQLGCPAKHKGDATNDASFYPDSCRTRILSLMCSFSVAPNSSRSQGLGSAAAADGFATHRIYHQIELVVGIPFYTIFGFLIIIKI